MFQIALIAGTYLPRRCGVAHYTAHLRQALDEVPFTLLTTHAAALSDPETQVMGAVRGWGLRDLPALIRAIRATSAQILHIQHAAGTYGFERAIFLLPLLLRLSGWFHPIVTTVHEYGWWEWQPPQVPPRLLEGVKQWGQNRGWWDREDGFLLTGSDALITPNSAVAETILQRLPHLSDRLHLIPLAPNIDVVPLDREVARWQLRQDCQWPGEAIVLTFFGFLHPTKGLETLLAAFSQIAASHPQTRLLLLGGVESLALSGANASSYWDQLQAQITAMGLDQRVHLTGYLAAERASAYLTGSDLGVLPFNHGVTGKSGALLAMLAHGLPIVATHSYPPDPTLTKAEILQFVPPRQPAPLAIAITQLLADPARQAQLRRQSQEFGQQFTWRAIAQIHRQIYHQLHPKFELE